MLTLLFYPCSCSFATPLSTLLEYKIYVKIALTINEFIESSSQEVFMRKTPTYDLERTIVNAAAKTHAILGGMVSEKEVLVEIVELVRIDPEKIMADADEDGSNKFDEWVGKITAKSIELRSVDPQG
ncbi:MAG: hypothetical protein JWO96_48 [Candidatus Saccharibacteria bacterium]|nr:hypothetical protein [Candidatus Saccharibacteria bacterium]